MRCLILRLEGPLMAFGDVAVDEIRPTRLLPTLSMLTGLLGNALGLDHREVEALDRLQGRLRFATRRDRPGRVIVDYQTVQPNRQGPSWTTRGVPTERPGDGTIERWRHYLADAAVTVALTLIPENEPPTPDDLAAALARPERPLFLGRKGCPPARPILHRGPFEAAALAAALAAVPGGEDASVELPDDLPGEPIGRRVIEVADRRDWRAGFHAGTRRVRELAPARGGEEAGGGG